LAILLAENTINNLTNFDVTKSILIIILSLG